MQQVSVLRVVLEMTQESVLELELRAVQAQ